MEALNKSLNSIGPVYTWSTDSAKLWGAPNSGTPMTVPGVYKGDSLQMSSAPAQVYGFRGDIDVCGSCRCDYSTASISKNFVETIAKSGEICRNLGHRWGAVNDNMVITMDCLYYADPETRPQWRTCSICGRRESRVMGEWQSK